MSTSSIGPMSTGSTDLLALPKLVDLQSKRYNIGVLMVMERAALREAMMRWTAEGKGQPTSDELSAFADEQVLPPDFPALHDAYHSVKKSLLRAETDDLRLVADHLAQCAESVEYQTARLLARDQGSGAAVIERLRAQLVARYADVIEGAQQLRAAGVIAVNPMSLRQSRAIESLADRPSGPLAALYDQAKELAAQRNMAQWDRPRQRAA